MVGGREIQDFAGLTATDSVTTAREALMPDKTGNPLAQYMKKHGDLTQSEPVERLSQNYEAAFVSSREALNELSIAVASENPSHADIAEKKGVLDARMNELEPLHEAQADAMRSWLERMRFRKDDPQRISLEERSIAARSQIAAIKNEGEKLWKKANADATQSIQHTGGSRSRQETVYTFLPPTTPSDYSNNNTNRPTNDVDMQPNTSQVSDLTNYSQRLQQQEHARHLAFDNIPPVDTVGAPSTNVPEPTLTDHPQQGNQGQPHQSSEMTPPIQVANAAAVQSMSLKDFAQLLQKRHSQLLRQTEANQPGRSNEMPPPPRPARGGGRPAPEAGPTRRR